MGSTDAIRDLVQGELKRAGGSLSKEELQEATALAATDIRAALGALREEGLLVEHDSGRFELDEDEAPLPIPEAARAPVAAGPDVEARETEHLDRVGAVLEGGVDETVRVVQGETGELPEYVGRVLIEVRVRPTGEALPPVSDEEREFLGHDRLAVEQVEAVRNWLAGGLSVAGAPEVLAFSSAVESVEAVARRRVYP